MKKVLILLVVATSMMGFKLHHFAKHKFAVPNKRTIAAKHQKPHVDRSDKLINTSWKLKFYDCENCAGRPNNWILSFNLDNKGMLGNMPIAWQMKDDTVSVRLMSDTICQFNRIIFADENLMYGSQYCKDDVTASHFIASKISVNANHQNLITENKPMAVASPIADGSTVLSRSGFSFFDKSYMFKKGFDKNYGKRAIDVIVIHSSFCIHSNDPFDLYCVLGEYRREGVAPHYVIDRAGNIHKLVDENNVAHHAGFGKLPDGYNAINTRSLGIELINSEKEGPTNDQYEALARLTKDIKSRHRIKYIKGHYQIAPDRKTDPWRFNWKLFYDLIRDNP